MSQREILLIKKQQLQTLTEIWKDMFTRELNCPHTFPKLYDEVMQAYTEKHRKYHNITHLVHCFKEFQNIKDQLQSPAAVMFAIWYHDFVYDTGAHNNEEESAKIAQSALRSTSIFDDEFIYRVSRMIIDSKHTNAYFPKDIDTHFFLDIDLSILGSDEETFDTYEKQIRLEYFWVDETIYRNGRRKVLESFIKGSSIYRTGYFKAKYEKQAIANLKRSLAKLRL